MPDEALIVEARGEHLLAVKFAAMASPCEILLPSMSRPAALAIGTVAAATSIVPPPLRLAAATPNSKTTELDKYVGRYEFASVTVLEIQRQHDELSAVFPGAPADLLSARAADRFHYKDADVTIQFKRDANGQITGLNFEQNGAVTYAARVDSARVQAIQEEIAER